MNSDENRFIISSLIYESANELYDVNNNSQPYSEQLDELSIFKKSFHCICGFKHKTAEDITCSRCNFKSHRNCYIFPTNFDYKNFVCWFCRFKENQEDPFAVFKQCCDYINNAVSAARYSMHVTDQQRDILSNLKEKFINAKTDYDKLQIQQDVINVIDTIIQQKHKLSGILDIANSSKLIYCTPKK